MKVRHDVERIIVTLAVTAGAVASTAQLAGVNHATNVTAKVRHETVQPAHTK